MKTTSVKTNYILNLANTVSGILFPLITFPYAARIILADGLGRVNFLDSIVGNILLITSIGIPLYAVREVAKVRHDPFLRSKTAIEILLLHASLTVLAYLIIFTIAATVPQIRADAPLFLLLSSSIFFTAIGAQWFYTAIEDFKYITLRAIFIKIVAAAALFLLVKEKNDVLWYGGINVAASVGNNLFNFIRLRKHISMEGLQFNQLNIRRHLKPSLKIFALNLIISIYIQLDSIMLGFLKNTETVGYYAVSSKLTKMILGIVTALGTVLLPRFTNFLSTGRRDEFIEMGNKAISFTAAMVFPMATGLILLAAPIIEVFSGPTYEPSILTLRIIAPVIIFLGFSSLIGLQTLYPQGKENLVIASCAAGAFVNVTANLLLIPQYAQYGAAFASLLAEITVLVTMLCLGRRYLPFQLLSKQNLNYLIGTAIMGIIVYFSAGFLQEPWLKIVVGIPCGVLVYFLYLLACKDHFIFTVKKILFK